MLTRCPNNRTGWLILSNHAYPSAHLCSNQSEVIMWWYLLIVRMSHDHMMSHDCFIHIMWSIPQSRDVQSRKLKTIKCSVRDTSQPRNSTDPRRPGILPSLSLTVWRRGQYLWRRQASTRGTAYCVQKGGDCEQTVVTHHMIMRQSYYK